MRYFYNIFHAGMRRKWEEIHIRAGQRCDVLHRQKFAEHGSQTGRRDSIGGAQFSGYNFRFPREHVSRTCRHHRKSHIHDR